MLGTMIRVVSMIFIVLTPVVAARTLDPAGVGQVMIVVSAATMVGVVSQLGLPWAVSLRVAEVRSGRAEVGALRDDLRGVSLLLLTIAAVLVVASAAPWGVPPGWVVPSGTRAMLLGLVLVGVCRATSRIFSEINKGYGYVNTAAVGSDMFGPAAGLVFAMIASFVTDGEIGVEMFIGALAAGWLLAVLFTWWRAPVRPSLFPRTKRSGERRLGQSLMVLGCVSVLNVGIQQAHILIAGYTLELNDAGVFSTAARLATLAGAPLMVISSIAAPDLGTALQGSDSAAIRAVERRLQRLTGAFLIASAALCLVYLLRGAQLMDLIFGVGYSAGHRVLVILSLGPLGSLWAGVAGLSLILAGEQIRMLKDTVFGSGVAVVGMVIGAIYFGGAGLAVGYSVGQLAVNLLLLRSCRRIVGLMPAAKPLSAIVRR